MTNIFLSKSFSQYETSFHGLRDVLGEYESIDMLNELAEMLDELSEDDEDKLNAIMECRNIKNIFDIVEQIQNLDNFDLLPDVDDDTALGYYYVDELGCFEIPDNIRKDAVRWQKEEMPLVIKQLEQVDILDENMTMAELISEYMEYSSARRRITTCGTKENIIEKKILPYFKDKRVFKITPWEIEKWQNDLLKSTTSTGKEYSATYIRSIRSQLTAIFNYAVRLHNLPNNPMDKVEMIGKKKADERPFWTAEQYKLFRDQIADKPTYYYAFEVLFWCGLRMGELLALVLVLEFHRKRHIILICW